MQAITKKNISCSKLSKLHFLNCTHDAFMQYLQEKYPKEPFFHPLTHICTYYVYCLHYSFVRLNKKPPCCSLLCTQYIYVYVSFEAVANLHEKVFSLLWPRLLLLLQLLHSIYFHFNLNNTLFPNNVQEDIQLQFHHHKQRYIQSTAFIKHYSPQKS